MKVSRNDPCPCGSGKKYKKCCLKKEREEKVSFKEDPKDALFDRFKKGDYREKIKIYNECLAVGMLDGELAFEMLATIHTLARQRGEDVHFASLVDSLKRYHPEYYNGDIIYYNSYLIEGAVLHVNPEVLPELLEPFSRDPDRSIDEFFHVIDLLMCHSHTKPLLDVMKKAWPKVKRSDEILSPGIEEFADIIGWLLIFEHLESKGSVQELFQALDLYWDIDMEELKYILDQLSGESPRIWEISDFIKLRDKKTLFENVFSFSLDFVGELHKKGIPFSRGILAKWVLIDYLSDSEHFEETKKGSSILELRPASLDRYVGGLLQILNQQLCRAVCLMEAVPYYLEFLLSRGLISEEDFKLKIKAMTNLKIDFTKLLEHYQGETGIEKAFEESWKRVL